MSTNPIKKGTKPDGTVYYWFRVEVGRDPVTGRRKQKYQQFDKLKDAKTEYAKISHEVGKGSYVHVSALTVADYLEAWAANRCRDKSAATTRTYVDSFRPVRELLGARRLQTVTQRDVEDVVEWMTTVGRKRGGKAGTPLSPRSVQMTLSHLRAALADAADDGLIVRNVARKVRGPKLDPAPIVPWTDAEVKAFLTAIKGDRLYPVMRLSLTALRPSEVCGLRWAAVDLKAKTLTIRRVRTLVMGEAIEKEPKSKAGWRALPLDDMTVTALEAFKAQQTAEKAAAGSAYEDLGYVLCDELGRPVKVDWLRRRFKSLVMSANVRPVRLYDARHACLTYLANNGVPDVVVSAWAGHSRASTTKENYVHPHPEDLAKARDVLSQLLD